MTATITGNGIDKVQDGTIQSADFAAGVPGRSNLPAGTVLQVVQGSTFTQVSTSSNSYTDTGLTATITPTSATSKILVLVEHSQNEKSTGNVGMQLKLLRNGTDINTFGTYVGFTGNTNDNYFRAGGSFLDSPNSTSALTYKTQFGAYNNTSVIRVQSASVGSTMILMEIAA